MVGGTTPQARNLLSGNSQAGFGAATRTLPNRFFVQGNFIGTDVTGKLSLRNDGGGAFVDGLNLVIGGTTAGARNVISGNGGSNVDINTPHGNSGAEANLIQGNFIGTDVTGTAGIFQAAANAGASIAGFGTKTNTIGGTTPSARNIIAGNLGDGVRVFGFTTGNLIQGNYIGLDVSGASALPNSKNGISNVTMSANGDFPVTGLNTDRKSVV